MKENFLPNRNMSSNVKRFIILSLIATLIMSFAPMVSVKNVYAADDEGGKGSDDNGLNIEMDDDGNVTNSLDDDSDSTGTWNTIFQKYKVVVAGVSGIAAITFILLFIVNFVKIGSATDNPQKRNEAIRACLWTGIAAAGCGSVTAFTALFWNAFK